MEWRGGFPALPQYVPIRCLRNRGSPRRGGLLRPDSTSPPSRLILAVRTSTNKRGREAVFLRWGLIPRWAKDPSIGNRMINARAETVAEKPAFRDAIRHRRCLVPTSGFYEWKKEERRKQPSTSIGRMAAHSLSQDCGIIGRVQKMKQWKVLPRR